MFYGNPIPVFATVYKWANEFKRGRRSTKDEHRSGGPLEVNTPEMIDKIHDMVLSDWRIKVRGIVEATGILQGTVFLISHEKLGVKKILARWVPRFLSKENKCNRLIDSEAILALFRRNPDEFLPRYITVHETWIHRYNGTVETVEFWRRTGSKEGEDGEIGRQGDVHGFLGCTQNHLHRLLGKRKNYNWKVLCVVEITKNVLIWKRSFSFKTMHGCTSAQFRWPKIWN